MDQLAYRLCLVELFKRVLGLPEIGTMAFVRCLTPDVVQALASDSLFTVDGWTIRRVADFHDEEIRTITADRAVEIRESKSTPILLLVDTSRAGRCRNQRDLQCHREIDEIALFKESLNRQSGNHNSTV